MNSRERLEGWAKAGGLAMGGVWRRVGRSYTIRLASCGLNQMVCLCDGLRGTGKAASRVALWWATFLSATSAVEQPCSTAEA